MRRLLPPLALTTLVAMPLGAQSTQVTMIVQPRAVVGEFTVPVTELQVRDGGDFAQLHLGVGLGARHWFDGDTALRFVADANATANDLFAGVAAIIEVPPGEGAFIGPRVRVGWAFHPHWALSLEGEHLERPFAPGLTVARRSSLGLALTVRF